MKRVNELSLLGHEQLWKEIAKGAENKFGYNTPDRKKFNHAYGQATDQRGQCIFANEVPSEYRPIFDQAKENVEKKLKIQFEWDIR